MPITLPPVMQQTDSHCGPAVLELLLKFQGICESQDKIVEAAQVKSRINKYGSTPQHLVKAVKRLSPHLQFWFKQHTTPEDLHTLIHHYNVPVGINWQGLFYDTLEEEEKDFPHENLFGEHGHYSVIIDTNPQENTVTIADTYSDYYQTPRTFSYTWFESRWWDKDLRTDPKTKKKSLLTTEQMSFIVVPRIKEFPQLLGMQLPTKLPIYEPYSPRSKQLFDGQLRHHRHRSERENG